MLRNFSTIVITDTTSGIIGSVFWLYLASLLTVSNYGEIQFLISIAGFGVGIAMLANNNTVIVQEVKKRGIRSTLFLLTLIGGGIVSIFLFIFYSRTDIILLTLGMIFGEMVLGYLIGRKLFLKYLIFLISQKVLMVGLAIGLYFVLGLEGIIYGIAISYIPNAIVVINSCRGGSIKFSLLKENLGFIINNYAVRLIALSRKNLDKIIIMSLLGFDVLGGFSLALQIYLAMNLLTTISSKFLLFNDAAGRNLKKFQILIIGISVIISILGITLAPKIIPLFFPQFTNSIEILPIMSLAVIPNAIIVIFSSKFLGDEKSKYVLVGSILYAVIYLALVAILGSIYGLLGISIGFLLSTIINACYLVTMYNFKIKNKF